MKFHRVISDFMIQTGDPTATGIGGDSIWKQDFEDEFNENLFNITGSVAMANKGANTNSSQFFINYSSKQTDWKYLESFYNAYLSNKTLINQMYGGCVNLDKLPSEARTLYDQYGGNVHLDGAFRTAGSGHTVFGQVFEGLEVVEKISKVATGENNKPIGEITIKSVTIEIYE